MPYLVLLSFYQDIIIDTHILHIQTFRFIFFFGDAGRSGSGAGCSGTTGRVWAALAATAGCVWDDNEVKLVAGMDIELERLADCTEATVW